MKTKKQQIIKVVLLIVTIGFALIIFIQSSMTAAESTVESDAAFSFLDKIASFLQLPNFLTNVSIRKVAHFAEFAVFGVLLSTTVLAWCGKLKEQVFKILFFLLAVPVTDEFIQYFSEGRSSEIKDVLLDFSGGITGFLLIMFVCCSCRLLSDYKSNS